MRNAYSRSVVGIVMPSGSVCASFCCEEFSRWRVAGVVLLMPQQIIGLQARAARECMCQTSGTCACARPC